MRKEERERKKRKERKRKKDTNPLRVPTHRKDPSSQTARKIKWTNINA